MTNLSFSREDEEEDHNQLKEFDNRSSSSSSSRLKILNAAGVINPLSIVDNESITEADILAELAYCYDPTNRVRKPDRITHDNLLSGHKPSAIYYKNYERYIPADILEAAGLIVIEPEQETDTGNQASQNVTVTSEVLRWPFDSSDTERLPNGHTTEWAWDAMIRMLEIEMPRSTFIENISSAVPLGYRAGTIYIGAESEYQVRWLEGRMYSTMRRILTGLTNYGVDVKFLAPENHV